MSGPELPPELVREVLAGRCVAFLGAGMSMPAVPGWRQLLGKLAEARGGDELAWVARACGDVNSSSRTLEIAAEAVRAAYADAGEFERAVANALRADTMHRDAIEERYAALMEVPFAAVLTTNQDDLLHGAAATPAAYEALLREPSRWAHGARWDRGDARDWTTVLKIHGEANGKPRENPVVLAQTDYRRRLYEDGRYANFLRTVFATRTVLFLGFSFTDAYLNELRSEVLAMLGRPKAPLAYALLPGVDDGPARTLLASERLRVLSYDARGAEGHGAVGAWIERLREATSPPRRLRRALERMGKSSTVVWVDRNHQDNNGRLVRVLDGERIGVIALGGPEQLVESEHASAALVLCSFDTRNEVAVRLLNGVRTWKDRPPVIVFTWPTSISAKRRACMRLGAAAVCSQWDELYDAIERVLGVGDEAGQA